MKLLFAVLLLSMPALAQSLQTLPIDAKASTLHWTGHAEVGSYAPSGTLNVQRGSIVLSGDTVRSAELTIDMTSLAQSNADLTHHLKSADFFDVEHYPTALIRIDKVERGTVSGTMTIKDKTAPFQAPVKVSEANGRYSVTGSVTLDRTKYGILYNSKSFFSNVGDKAIRNTFEVDFALAGNGEIPAKYRD